jgi:hypothetical protein
MGNRRGLMLRRPVEAVPKRATKLMQLLTLAAYPGRFSMLFLSCKAVPPPIIEALSQNDYPKSQRPSDKAIPSLCFQVLEIHPTKVLFIKDKFPDGFMFPPVTIAASQHVKTFS